MAVRRKEVRTDAKTKLVKTSVENIIRRESSLSQSVRQKERNAERFQQIKGMPDTGDQEMGSESVIRMGLIFGYKNDLQLNSSYGCRTPSVSLLTHCEMDKTANSVLHVTWVKKPSSIKYDFHQLQ